MKATMKDAKVVTLLSAIYQRLNLLEQHVGLLKLATLDKDISAPSGRTFGSLRGAWRGIDISEEDIEKAQISLPNDL